MFDFGKRLKNARERKGLTQRDVMELTGVTNKSLSRYENNTTSPDPDVIRDLLLLYDVSADYLFGLSDDMGHAHPEDRTEILDPETAALFHQLSEESQGKADEYIKMLHKWEN